MAQPGQAQAPRRIARSNKYEDYMDADERKEKQLAYEEYRKLSREIYNKRYDENNELNNNQWIADDNQPKSGRYFIWYGWRDKVDANSPDTLPLSFMRNLTLRCAHIDPVDHIQCAKQVALCSEYCHIHLNAIGIHIDTTYKTKSPRTIQSINGVFSTTDFSKNDIVFRIYYEDIDKDEHEARYQIPDRSGPHELVLKSKTNNKFLYIDFARMASEIDFIKIDNNKGNLYLDITPDLFNSKFNLINVRALDDINDGDQLYLKLENTPSEQYFEVIERANHTTALYIETFAFRGLPFKYRNRSYREIRTKKELKVIGLDEVKKQLGGIRMMMMMMMMMMKTIIIMMVMRMMMMMMMMMKEKRRKRKMIIICMNRMIMLLMLMSAVAI